MTNGMLIVEPRVLKMLSGVRHVIEGWTDDSSSLLQLHELNLLLHHRVVDESFDHLGHVHNHYVPSVLDHIEYDICR